ncbi:MULTISPECIES: hypothetical protein [unclassified Streptomyces]|uniref:hypothetical protein n=1 Tax=unclassified Streptomyces TaxID=2593676 RepID=UPI002E2ED020|nr:hypothetical protein [Streptomyces sp. NBC_01278]
MEHIQLGDDLDLEAFVEELDDAANPGLSTAATLACAGSFAGSCASSGSSFSTASS